MNTTIGFTDDVLGTINALSDTELIERIAKKHEHNNEYLVLLSEEAKRRNIDFAFLEDKTDAIKKEYEEKLKCGNNGNGLLKQLVLILIPLFLIDAARINRGGSIGGMLLIYCGIFLFHGLKLKNAKELSPYSNTKFFKYNSEGRKLGISLIVLSIVVFVFSFLLPFILTSLATK